MTRFALKSLAVLAAGMALGCLASTAAAQDDGVVPPPKSNCVKPDFPGRVAPESAKQRWRKEVDTYGECVKRYAAAQRGNAETFMKAGNAAIEEYNAAIKQYHEEMKE